MLLAKPLTTTKRNFKFSLTKLYIFLDIFKEQTQANASIANQPKKPHKSDLDKMILLFLHFKQLLIRLSGGHNVFAGWCVSQVHNSFVK